MFNLMKYHESLSDELYALKDRIRDLVIHWGTDGASKECILRSVLRRHLPQSVIVGTGFVVSKSGSSTQIDILIIDANKPTLFNDGDVLIVTPDCVRAAIEVKTKLRTVSEFKRALTKLSQIEGTCHKMAGNDDVFTGLFVYENETDQHLKSVLTALGLAYLNTGRPVDCVSVGKSVFARYWPIGIDVYSNEPGPVWHSYKLPNVAPSYFVGNLLDRLTTIDDATSSFAWFPIVKGKEPYRKFYLATGKKTPSPY